MIQYTRKNFKGNRKTTTRYLGWKDCGGIYAFDCYKREDIEKTTYPKKAFELGMHIKEID